MRHSGSENEPCLQISHPSALSAAQILVTLGLGKLLSRVERRKGFQVSFIIDSLCISKKKLSTRHTSLSKLSMCVFRPAEHGERICVLNKQHHSCGNSSHFLRTLTPGSMWASVMSATQLHLHPFLLSTPAQSSSENRAQTPAYHRKSFKLGTGDVCQVSDRPVP